MATVGRRASTELRLVAVRPDGVSADLLVEAAEDVPAQAVVEAIATEVGADGTEATLRGEPVPGEAPLQLHGPPATPLGQTAGYTSQFSSALTLLSSRG